MGGQDVRRTCPLTQGPAMRMDSQAWWLAAILFWKLLATSVCAEELPANIPADARAPLPTAGSQTSSNPNAPPTFNIPDMTKRENFSAGLQLIILLTVLSLAPAILIMMTSFTRIVIVLSLLRQAMGTQQLPPNQILIGLSLFMTFLVMGPTWKRVNDEALQPYLNGTIDQKQALSGAQGPVREFMISQIVKQNNDRD